MSFLSIQLLNELFYPFHLTYNLSPFFLITFSILNSFWFVFCNAFSWNVPTVSSPLRSLITYVHRIVFLTFFNHKKFFRPIWSVNFCKNVFTFWNSNSITNFNFRIFIINFLSRLIDFLIDWLYLFDFTSTGYILLVLRYVLLYLLTISSNLSI